MKILFVVPYAPTLIRVRPYQLIRTLASQGHDITLATLWTSEEERSDLHQISQHCRQVLTERLSYRRAICNMMSAVCTPWPLQSAYCWQPDLARNITSLLRNCTFDIVHIEHLRGARYGLAAKKTLATEQRFTPVIWDSVDCISHLFQQAIQHSRSLKGRLMTQLDFARTQRYESWLVQQFERVLVTSSTEKQALATLVQESKRTSEYSRHSPLLQIASIATDSEQKIDQCLEVVANGVDLEYFAPQFGVQGEADIVFTGKMSYHANVTAALYLVREIMPRVWAKRRDATVWIVGKEPPAEIRALATVGNEKRVIVTGTVPDIRPYLHRATMAVAPILYGAGIQNKLLEAMAAGVPVVSSPQAVAGLYAQSKESLVVADSADAFANAILHLLHEKSECVALGQNGRRYVEEHHAWPNVASQLEGVYQTAIAAKQRPVHANSL